MKSKFSLVVGIAYGTLIATGASANPSTPTVSHGDVSFSQNGATLSITNSPGSIIDWQDFSIQNGELTRFIQQNSQSSVLNRVTSQLPSNLTGDLTSNGKVFLINPNGLAIGAGARIDTAGFLASTLDISNEDFLAGRLHFKGEGGYISNQGYIRAGKGGEVVLIAPQVENNGIIETDSGEILLAAGREVRLTSLDDANISFKVQAPGNHVINLGKLIAQNGSVRVFADSIASSGSVSANRVTQNADGSIRLEAGSDITVSGTLTAQGQGTNGGEILVLGETVSLQGASLNASGQNGGTILVGGDYQGNGAVNNAQNTSVDAQSTLSADAQLDGNGGKVIVWSDNTTNSQGKITARGGAQSGDGGLVETSGKGTLSFGQPADVSAPNGAPGTWLIDPEDITINGAQADSISSSLNGGSNVVIKTSDGGSGEGNITVASAISKTQGPDASLSLDAHNNINVNAPITSTEGKLDVNLRAGNNISVNANVVTNGGHFSSEITGIVPVLPEQDQEEVEATETSDSSDTNNEQIASEPTEDEQSDALGSNTLESDALTSETDALSPEAQDALASLAPQATDKVDATQINPTSAPDSTLDQQSDPILAQEAIVVDAEPSDVVAPQQTQSEFDSALDDQRAQLVIQDEIYTNGGDISLDASASGDVLISGSLDSSSASTVGGAIRIEGERIALVDNAIIDASGAEGGGEVLIGGGQQGQDARLRNSQLVVVGENARVKSDGMHTGDGGRVIVFADDTAIVNGSITAKGGSQSGDGGFIETSGLKGLRVTNAPDVSAIGGEHGQWLIDPYNITIGDVIYDINILDTDATANQFWQPTANDAAIDLFTIQNGLAGGDVIVTTTKTGAGTDPDQVGNITWEGDLDLSGLNSVGSLELRAHNDINMYGSIHDGNLFGFTSSVADLTLIANQDGLGGGDVNISAEQAGGDVLLEATGVFSISGDNLLIEGGDTTAGQVNIQAGQINFGTSGSPLTGTIDIHAGQDESVDEASAVEIRASFIGSGSLAPEVNLFASGDITVAGGAHGNENSVLINSPALGGKTTIDSQANINLVGGGKTGDINDVKIQGEEILIDAEQDLIIQTGNQGFRNDVIIGREFTNQVDKIELKVGNNFNVEVLGGDGNSAEIIAGNGFSNPDVTTLDIDVGGTTKLEVQDGSANGNIRISADMMNLDFIGDTDLLLGSTASSRISVNGDDVSFNVGNLMNESDLTMVAGSALDGGSPIVVSGFEKLQMDVTGAMSLRGGVGNNNTVEIQSNGDGIATTMGGAGEGVNITAKSLSLLGGSGGEGNHAQIQADALVLDVEDDVTLNGGSSAVPMFSDPMTSTFIPSKESDTIAAGIIGRSNSVQANHTYTIGGNLNLQGGDVEGARAQIGGQFIDNFDTNPNPDASLFENLTINVTGDINLRSGTAADTSARIISTSTMDISAENINMISGAIQGADSIIKLNGDVPSSPPANANISQAISANDTITIESNTDSKAAIEMMIAANTIGTTFTGEQQIDVLGDLIVNSMAGGDAAVVSELGQTIKAINPLTPASIQLMGRGASTAKINGVDQDIDTNILNINEGEITSTNSTIDTEVLNWMSGRLSSESGILTTTGIGAMPTAGIKSLSGITWNQQGNLDWSGGNIEVDEFVVINNSGQFNVSGDDSLTNLSGGGSIIDLPKFNNSGTFTKTGGAGESIFDDIETTNSGDIDLQSGTLRLSSGSFTQTAGSLDLNGGDLNSDVTLDIQGGSLVGDGLIEANIDLGAATIGPGHSPGTITIAGDLTASAGSIFDIELGGVNPGEYDVIDVDGDVTLAGSLVTTFIDGYSPVVGAADDSFDVIRAATMSGSFGSIDTGPAVANVTPSSNQSADTFNLRYEIGDTPPVDPTDPTIPDPPGNPSNPPDQGQPTPTSMPPVVITPETPDDTPPAPDVTDIVVTLVEQEPELEDFPPRREIQMCFAGDNGI